MRPFPQPTAMKWRRLQRDRDGGRRLTLTGRAGLRGVAGGEHRPDDLAHGTWLGTAPFVAQGGDHVEPAARLVEPAGVLGDWELVTGIGDRAQDPRSEEHTS